jgi:uncharacterized protein YdeI (YjbR/CyaY-like superfamily)
MPKKDSRVDAYIAKSADFAKPILNHIRKLVHVNCPDVQETLKWGAPFFDHQGLMIGMAGFKEHCRLIFWKGKLIFGHGPGKAAEQFGLITSLADLPGEKILSGYIKKAAELNEAGVKPTQKAKPRKELVVPDYFMAALKKNKKALAAFENFPPSHKREYVEWIIEAKRDETRAKRIETAIDWMCKGKSRNWKYEKR